MALGDGRSPVGTQFVLLGLVAVLPGLAGGQPSDAAGTAEAGTLQAAASVHLSPGFPSALSVSAESLLRQAAQQALWPADIARLSAEYLQRYPQQAWARDADCLLQRAAWTADLLQQADIHLYRSAFDGRDASPEHLLDLRLAALGDPAASWRMAQRLPPRDGSLRRHVGWLQYAASLGGAEAAYTLALHYRRDAQPLLAARYEARAIALGFQPPTALDHRRR